MDEIRNLYRNCLRGNDEAYFQMLTEWIASNHRWQKTLHAWVSRMRQDSYYVQDCIAFIFNWLETYADDGEIAELRQHMIAMIGPRDDQGYLLTDDMGNLQTTSDGYLQTDFWGYLPPPGQAPPEEEE